MYIRSKYRSKESNASDFADFYIRQIEYYLGHWLIELDGVLDKRLVRTFVDLFIGILRFRNRAFGLVLSQLGGIVDHPTHAPAGTKRISNLLRSNKWTHSLIETFLLSKGVERVNALEKAQNQVLFLWDDSVLEKPESNVTEGLCPVSSSKAKRLLRIKPGYYDPPCSRIYVPGFAWSSVVMTTLNSIPALVMMRWWSTRGKACTDPVSVWLQMLKKIAAEFKNNKILHVFDRGYANATHLEFLFKYQQGFLIRWIKSHQILNTKGELVSISRFFKPSDVRASRLVQLPNSKKRHRIKIFFAAVKHPEFPQQEITLITCKTKGSAHEPVHLITNQSVKNHQHAWKIYFCYFRRWNIEQTFRFNKSELALESPRLWFIDNRLKLMAIVSLVYDFLLQILRNWKSLALLSINTWCPRTGEKLASVKVPIYRLRIAIQEILNEFIIKNSG